MKQEFFLAVFTRRLREGVRAKQTVTERRRVACNAQALPRSILDVRTPLLICSAICRDPSSSSSSSLGSFPLPASKSTAAPILHTG